MAEITEFFREVIAVLKHPDIVVLGGMFCIFIIGFTCGVLAYEVHAIKHQIKMHRYHGKRRDGEW